MVSLFVMTVVVFAEPPIIILDREMPLPRRRRKRP